MNFKIIDVKDMNTLDFAAPILKKALELGLGGIPGTGVFSAVVDATKKQAGDLLEQKIDELVNSGDKLLFEMDFPPLPKDEKTIKPGALP